MRRSLVSSLALGMIAALDRGAVISEQRHHKLVARPTFFLWGGDFRYDPRAAAAQARSQTQRRKDRRRGGR